MCASIIKSSGSDNYHYHYHWVWRGRHLSQSSQYLSGSVSMCVRLSVTAFIHMYHSCHICSELLTIGPCKLPRCRELSLNRNVAIMTMTKSRKQKRGSHQRAVSWLVKTPERSVQQLGNRAGGAALISHMSYMELKLVGGILKYRECRGLKPFDQCFIRVKPTSKILLSNRLSALQCSSTLQLQ